MKPNIDLHIDQLVLDGFSRNDAHYIGKSMQVTLQHLITTRGISAALKTNLHQRSINSKPLRLKTSSSPEQIGHQLAHNIYRGILGNTKKN